MTVTVAVAMGYTSVHLHQLCRQTAKVFKRVTKADYDDLDALDISYARPTHRGASGGRKQCQVTTAIPVKVTPGRTALPTPSLRNNTLIQVPTVSRDSAVIVDKCKFGLINARCLRNKSLFVRNYVDECSLDTVALTETWLTDEDTTSVSELCRDNFTLVHQPRGSARRGGGIGVLFRKTVQLISRVTVDTRASETLRHSTKRPHLLHNACIRDVPATELMFWDFPRRCV